MTFEDVAAYLPDDVRTVEAAESDLRRFIRDAVLRDLDKSSVREGTERIVRRTLLKLKSADVREKARVALPRFAALIYDRMRALVTSARAAAALLSPKTPEAGRRLSLVRRGVSDAELLAVLDDTEAYNVEPGDRTYFRAYHRRVMDALHEILNSKAKPSYSSNVNLRNIAEMTVRYERQRGHLDAMKQSGVRLVWIEPHANCSKRCERWQGRLYSLDGTSGKVEGIPFIPIETATDQYYTTKGGATYKNGCITGYNCRHKTIPFEGKQSRPDVVPASIVEKTRRAEEKQRAYERRIRYEREKREFLRKMNPKASAEAYRRAQALMREYKAFSKKESLAWVDERTRIAPGEGRIVKDIPKLIKKYARPAKQVRP